MKSFKKIRKIISQLLQNYVYSADQKLALEIIDAIDVCINGENKILSCNIDSIEDKENEALVLLVQNDCDAVLRDKKISLLETILKCGNIVKTYGSGNCQQKAFLAIKLGLEYCNQKSISSFHRVPAFEIKYCDGKIGHFFLIINNCMVYDPWAQLHFPVELLPAVLSHDVQLKLNIFDGKVRSYFKLDYDWKCYDINTEGKYIFCENSTNATYKIAPPPPRFLMNPVTDIKHQPNRTPSPQQRKRFKIIEVPNEEKESFGP